MIGLRCPLDCVLLSLTVSLSAFAAEPAASDADRLKESLAKWKQVREECGGDYSYEVRWSSAFGFGNKTTITVRGNKVTERKFEEFGQPKPIKPGEQPAPPMAKWVETGKDLGSHKEGAAARTVDDLYAEAQKLVASPVPAQHVRTLQFDKQGLLYYCFTRDTRIADDAPLIGIPPFSIQLPAKK